MGSAEGCHAKWEYLSSDYSNFDRLHDEVQKMRPDLTPRFDILRSESWRIRKRVRSGFLE
jgi:hypothetical protein